MKIAYVTDVHGDLPCFGHFLKEGGRKAEALVVGGDLAPGLNKGEQGHFLEKNLLPLLRKTRGPPLLLLTGNDDYRANLGTLEQGEREGLFTLLHQKTVALEGYFFPGYCCVPPGPLLIRDWIRSEEQIAADLRSLEKTPADRTVLVAHSPPHGTALDVIWSGQHVGSRAIRDFLKDARPLVSLHGHIHESPRMSGKVQERLGRTLAINPGNAKSILIDLETLRVESL